MTDNDFTIREAQEWVAALKSDFPYWEYVGDRGPDGEWTQRHEVYSADSYRASSNSEMTAKFIAAAAHLVPNLLAVIEQQQATIDRQAEALRQVGECVNGYADAGLVRILTAGGEA